MKRDTTHGFSMIEVLISIFVLAIGLLGIAGLQMGSLKAADSANMRSQAAMLSYDILDKMHANRTLALAGSYNVTIDQEASEFATTSIKDVDIKNWLNALDFYLPEGDGIVAVANGIATITVQWNDSRAKGGSAEQFVMSTAL